MCAEFPKDILFSEGQLYVGGCARLNSLLWETRAAVRIASKAESFLRDSFPSSSSSSSSSSSHGGVFVLARSHFSLRSYAPLHDRKDFSACSRRRREGLRKKRRRERRFLLRREKESSGRESLSLFPEFSNTYFYDTNLFRSI